MSYNRDEKITAILIIEVIGRPAEYLTETLENLSKNISEEPKVLLKNKKINEPCELKEQKDFYTNFAEIEVEVEDLLTLAALMFKYMPAHVEIIEPEQILSTNNDWNSIFNELTRRLHGYDEIARIMEMEKNILEKKLREVLGEKSEITKIEENQNQDSATRINEKQNSTTSIDNIEKSKKKKSNKKIKSKE